MTYSSQFTLRTCPTCEASHEPNPFMSADAPAETLSYHDVCNAWRGLFIKKRIFFSYHRCSSCRQLFSPIYFTPESLTKLYGEMDDNIHSGDEHLSNLTQSEYCHIASGYLNEASTYCEIGPDIGLFFQAARKHYALKEATLIEPNQIVWPRLQKTAVGLKVAITPTAERHVNNIPDGSLDLIVAIHVLDHLLEPKETLEWITRKLSKRGIVVFVVHNERSLLARLFGKRWPPYVLQHPQLYNPQTLKNALEKQGLQVKRILGTTNQFPLGYLISHAIFALTKRHCSLNWLSVSMKLKLGNIMAIASR